MTSIPERHCREASVLCDISCYRSIEPQRPINITRAKDNRIRWANRNRGGTSCQAGALRCLWLPACRDGSQTGRLTTGNADTSRVLPIQETLISSTPSPNVSWSLTASPPPEFRKVLAGLRFAGGQTVRPIKLIDPLRIEPGTVSRRRPC